MFPVSLISRLERERVDNIKLANLAAIANALQLQMADFFKTRVCKPLKLLSFWTTWPSSLKRNVKCRRAHVTADEAINRR